MGLFKRSADRPPRAQKRAERRASAAEAKLAAADAKVAADRDRTARKLAALAAATEADAQKSAARAEAKLSKVSRKDAKRTDKESAKAQKAEQKATEQAEEALAQVREPWTAKRAKRLIGVGQVVAPIVVPYLLSAVNSTRAAWDTRRAGKLGVEVDQLSRFAGPGGALHARLSHIADALTKLESDTKGDSTATAFAASTRTRLADLAVAVRAAERMPAPRRRAAYRAISHELDTIEATLLDHLGVTT